MSGTDTKYQKARDTASATVCTIPDPNIDVPHWKCVCWCCQNFPPFYLSDKDTITS